MRLAKNTTRTNTTRWTNWTAILALAALMLPAGAMPARAQVTATPATPVYVPGASNSTLNTGTGNVGPIPFSWLQFKQSFGLPGAPTVPAYPSYVPAGATTGNPNAYSALLGNAYFGPDAGNEYAGDYIRAYLLGDYGTNEPPGGFSNFFDEILTGTSGLVGWTAPDVNYGASSVSPIICDDDNTLNISSVTGGTPPATTTTVSGIAIPGAGWTLLSANVPNQIATDIDNYNGDSYYRTLAIPRSEFPTSNANPGPAAPYSYFHWYPNVTTPGAYTAYAWFPSQNATTTNPDAAHEERHVTDAEYQILINGVVVQTAMVDQQSGGTWVPIGGPFNFPIQSLGYTNNGTVPPTIVTGTTGTPNIEIRLDNTGTLNTSNPNNEVVSGDPDSVPYIVADAIQLRGEDGSTTRMVSSPVAVNKTDYPELFSGYSTTNYSDYTNDGKHGGLHPEYQQAHLVLAGTNGATGTITAGTAAAPITDVFTGSYQTTGPQTTVNAPQGGGSYDPMDQLVYFTRNETIASPTDPTNVQTVGAVYCVDGRNGNVVWRYPASNPTVINDTDTAIVPPATTANFTETGGTLANSATAYPPPSGGQYYYTAALAAGAPGAVNFAQWNLPLPATGTATAASYEVMVWVPAPATGEDRVTNAVYTINGAAASTCVFDQTTGGQWMPLKDINGNTVFTLTPGASNVILSNEVSAGGVPGGSVIVANAVEFVPAGSLGTIDSSPAIVRNMRVLTFPGGGGGGADKWETRTVVIVADNLGKVYALDASGNQDGNDTLYDTAGNPVSFGATGTPSSTLLPFTPKGYGTTNVYWIWQPNSSAQLANQIYDDNSNPTQAAATAGQSAFTPSGPPTDPYNPTGFTTLVTTPTAFLGTALSDTTITAPTAPTLPDFVTWQPFLPAGTSLCEVYVQYPVDAAATTDARYTVVDSAGPHVVTINQSINGGQFVFLGQYTFTPTAGTTVGPITAPNAAGQYALTPNSIVLDNVSATAGKAVYADAVRVDVIGSNQLITPLAFQMCSPTVALTPTNYTTYGMATPASGVPPTNDATIFIGNSNGVMYSLEGGGVFGATPVSDIRRDLSLDPNTPTVGVNWWFNFGGTVTDTAGENTLGTTYAPAYDPYDGPAEDPTQGTLPLASRTPDGLLYFTTFSPQALDDGGATNQGYLFAVDAKYGPFGDGGDTGGAYTVADPTSRVGTQKYTVNPVPYWTFPDKYGTLKTDPSIPHGGVTSPQGTLPMVLNLAYTYGVVTEQDHLVTSGIPAVGSGVYAFQPAATPVGDSAGAPIVYTASVTTSAAPFDAGNTTNDTSRRVYFAANDPNTEDPVAGRIYGIDPATGKLDPAGANSYPFIYPATLGVKPTTPIPSGTLSPNNPYGDPNLIEQNDVNALNAAYLGGTNYNENTTDVPNSFGAFTDQDASTGYFVSSSPVAAPITFPTNTADSPGAVTNPPTGGTGASGAGITTAGQIVQMMYMADLTGLMHYINLTGNPGNPTYSSPAIDLYKDVFDYQVGDTIISTPALVPDASGAGYTTPEPAPSTANPPTGTNVGGALFVTTEGGDIVELEAFPTVDPSDAALGTAVRLKDWTYSGPGGYSSPIVASFNTTNVVTGSTDLGDSEWIYVGGDQGTCYGFTPNNTSANGTAAGGSAPPAGAPAGFVGPQNLIPPATVPPNRNFYTLVTATPPPAVAATGTNPAITFDSAQGPPLNPVFDWGQTAYIEIFGVDQSNPASASNITPKAIRLTFTIKPVGRVARGLRTINKVIDLQSLKNVYPIATPGSGTTAWPPANTTLSVLSTGAPNPAAKTATGTIVGPNVAVYAYQLGDGTGDPQTPGPKVQIANVTEQVQYYDGSTPPRLMTVTINGTPDAGSIIRTGTAAAPGLGATAAIDEGTFSTLNPLAVRGAGRSLGATSGTSAAPTYSYYNLTLVPQGKTTLGQLGPFSGVELNPAGSGTGTKLAVSKNTAIFNVAQAAMTNGNSLLSYPTLGGLEYAYKPNTTPPYSDAMLIGAGSSTLTQVQQPPQYQAVVAASAGLISHGTNGTGSTPSKMDPATTGGPNNAVLPTASSSASGGGDYGEAVFNIMDRSDLGVINTPITRLRMNNPTLSWNDNSETGDGAGAVINPLPWDQLPQAFYVSGRINSPDYPDINNNNTSVQLLPRTQSYSSIVDPPSSTDYAATGSNTIITAADATLAASGADTTLHDDATRTLFPNAALINLAVPKYQPANLESYPQAESGVGNVLSTGTTGGTLAPGINHADTGNQTAANVAEGYVARGNIFIDTRGNGRRDRTEAYRNVQVWAGVPADASTGVAETTVDIGSVPAGFGLYGTTEASGQVTPTNDTWSPLIPGTTAPSPYAAFFKPITVINNGNVNLENVHLDQRLAGITGTGVADPSFPTFLPFQSDTINDPYGAGFGVATYGTPYPQSLVPSGDFPTAGTTVTGTVNLPLVRSNFDFFDAKATYSGGTWTDTTAGAQPLFNTFVPNAVLLNGTSLGTPGPTLHKPRPGDPQGTVMTIPDTPHNNYPNVNGYVNVATAPYGGRPVVSMAIPLGTPVGAYSSTIRAFEGYDIGSQTFQGPIYAGNPVTALTPWAPMAAQTPASTLTFNTTAGSAIQTASDPGTTLRATVVETRLTDGVPLPVNYLNGVGANVTSSAVLPMVDPAQTTVNSNDIQPWAFFDRSANQYTLLWTSARAATTSTLQQTDPYDLYGSGLASLTQPTNLAATNGSWWSAPASLTFPTAAFPTGVTAEASTNPSVVQLGNNEANAFWVMTLTQANNQKTYDLLTTGITYNGAHQPQITTPITLLSRTQPIFGPRAVYVYAGAPGSLAQSLLTVASGNLSSPSDPAPGNAPVIFWSTRVGGRSQILYWPAVKADPNNAGKIIVSSGLLPLPADLRSAANPTPTARLVNVVVNGTLTQVSAIDVTYTGVSGATGQSDVYTSRYLVNVNGDTPPSASDATAVTSLTLTLTPTLPTTNLGTNGYLPVEPTVTETLVSGDQGFQSQDTGWIRDTKAFELDILEQTVQTTVTTNVQGVKTSTSTITGGTTLPLIPSAFFSNLPANHHSQAVYDKSSGQWIFTVNWNELNSYYGATTGLGSPYQTLLLQFIQWLYGNASYTATTAPNLILYTNPAAGTVRFGVPIPTSNAITSTAQSANMTTTTNFVTLQALVNPQAQRVTFQSNTNVAATSFIDDTMKTNAGPFGATGGGTVSADVTTSREWYLYRKTVIGTGAASATSSVLYYKTRRLTVVLRDANGNPDPIQLTQMTNAVTGVVTTTVTNLSVTANGTDVTPYVDVDWSRGRIYFPDTLEGEQAEVRYKDAAGNNQDIFATITWQDEQQVNVPNGAAGSTEHVIPISNAVNESDPCAFLNPLAGDTQTTLAGANQNQSTAHSVWLFWSSARNAGGTNGSGADLYWETIDPRFEVVPGS